LKMKSIEKRLRMGKPSQPGVRGPEKGKTFWQNKKTKEGKNQAKKNTKKDLRSWTSKGGGGKRRTSERMVNTFDGQKKRRDKKLKTGGRHCKVKRKVTGTRKG